MQYNTTRTFMPITEYGRSVYQMVQILKTIPEKQLRTKAAHQIVDIMSNMNPQQKDAADFRQKLWDHLYILANYDLDIDAPFQMPDHEKRNEKPQTIPYPGNNIKIKHYGKIVERIIDKAVEMPQSQEKNQLVESIGNYMKLSFKTWNKSLINDEEVFADLDKLSKGKLIISDDIVLENIKGSPRDFLPQRNSRNKNYRNNKQRFQKKKNNSR